MYDEGYDHNHSLYSSDNQGKVLPKKIEIKVKGTDKTKRVYQLGFVVVDISKYRDEP
jgi:hypothetical protein